MDDLPHFEPVLESVRQDDVLDNFWSEAMAGSTPQSSQPKLGAHTHLRLFQQTFSRMVKLTNEWKVELRLPFLDESELHRTKITAPSEQWNWAPDEQVVVVRPIPKRKLRLHQFVILKL